VGELVLGERPGGPAVQAGHIAVADTLLRVPLLRSIVETPHRVHGAGVLLAESVANLGAGLVVECAGVVKESFFAGSEPLVV
jgi:hypothetical protein